MRMQFCLLFSLLLISSLFQHTNTMNESELIALVVASSSSTVLLLSIACCYYRFIWKNHNNEKHDEVVENVRRKATEIGLHAGHEIKSQISTDNSSSDPSRSESHSTEVQSDSTNKAPTVAGRESLFLPV